MEIEPFYLFYTSLVRFGSKFVSWKFSSENVNLREKLSQLQIPRAGTRCPDDKQGEKILQKSGAPWPWPGKTGQNLTKPSKNLTCGKLCAFSASDSSTGTLSHFSLAWKNLAQSKRCAIVQLYNCAMFWLLNLFVHTWYFYTYTFYTQNSVNS